MYKKITFKNLMWSVRLSLLLLIAGLFSGTAMAQTTITTPYAATSVQQCITWNFQNTNATPIVITNIGGILNGVAPAGDVTVYYKTTAINGLPGAITTANGWTQFGSANAVAANGTLTIQPLVTTNLTIPAGATYGICVSATETGGTAGDIVYNNTATGVSTVGGGGCNFITGTNIGYSGLLTGPTNSPRYYTGSITFINGIPCSGTPAPGATVSSTPSSCAGVGFTLSTSNPVASGTTGVTYQWQSSSTGAAGSFTNIAGATGATYTTTQTAATYYQVVVTCGSTGGGTANSTPLLVGLSAQCYCAAGSTDVDPTFEKIANVTMSNVNQSSTSLAGYESYLTDTIKVIASGTYPFSITGNGNTYDGDVVEVWIDFNQNGNFNDPGELVYNSGESAGPYTGNITIPAGATLGLTRMRIRLYDDIFGNGNNTPCGNNVYGQVEDYTVKIDPCVQINITGSPSDASATCGGNASFTATATGSLPVYVWEYRTTPTGVWLVVPNTAPYSNANTGTLNITGVTPAMNGYQYRAVISGACTGADVTSAATLTVTQIVATITPASATICTGGIQQLSLANTLNNTDLISEGFDAGVPPTWSQQNNSSPLGVDPWFAGDPTVFPPHSGAGYVAADYASTTTTGPGTISNWLFSPVVSIKNGDVISFWSRIPDLAFSGGTEFPDRLEVRLSTNGASTNVGTTATSVGDFTNVVLTINPALVTGVYPMTWTQFTGTVTGVTGTLNGRVGLRYFVTNGGGGANSDYIGVDDFVYTSTGAPAAGVWTGPAGTIFTNPAATTAYNGTTPVNTVYVKPTTTSTYSVNFQTVGGVCTSTTASATVTVNTPLAGTPAVAPVSACAGTPAVFTITGITGGSGFTYVWQVSTNNGVSYTTIAGETSSTLTIPGAATTQNGNLYRVIVAAAGCSGSATSAGALLTVNPTPVVTISAAPVVNVSPGVTSTLTAAVSSATGPLSYQWFLNGNPIPGATANMFVAGVDQEGQYTVQVTDANGCTSAAGSSTPASITIRDSANVTTLFIYPSPNSGRFQVRYYNDINNGGNAPGSVNVYDSKGARIFTRSYVQGAGYQAMNVDLGLHAKGLYRVELVDVSGNRIKTGSVMVF